METKNKLKQTKKIKYLAVASLLSIIMFCVSCGGVKQTSQTSKIKDKEVAKQEVKALENKPPVSLLSVEKPPIFPGCRGSKSELTQCLELKIKEHVKTGFNMKLKNSLGLKPGMKRILVMFAINKSGYISKIKIKAPHKKLEEEAVRLMKTLPKMTPGKYKGKYVEVGYYVFPIIFQLK